VQGRNTLEGVATRHASRSAQRTDPTFPDRLNFGGRQVVGVRCPLTGLTMQLAGFDAAKGKNPDANGEIALVGSAAAAAAPVRAPREPASVVVEDDDHYTRGAGAPLRSQGAAGAGDGFAAEQEFDTSPRPPGRGGEGVAHKKRSQFRVASRNITALYETVETVAV